jgi:hypothetical protein
MRLWRMDRTADSGLRNSLARHRVRPRPLIRHLPDRHIFSFREELSA